MNLPYSSHHVPPLADGHEGAKGRGESQELVVGRTGVADEGVVVERREYRYKAEGEDLQGTTNAHKK